MKRNTKRIGKVWLLVSAIGLLMVVALAIWAIYGQPAKPANIHDVAVTTAALQYCGDKDSSRTLDYFRPKGAGTTKLPLVVYIHGGGWRRGDENNPLLNNYGSQFIQKGIAVAAIDYRLNSANPFPDQNDDIACALSYLDANAAKLHIDIQKTLFFGDSAGGQLAAFAALNIPYNNYDYEAPVGVIDFYGVSDFSKIVGGTNPDLNARYYLGSKYNKVADAASPLTYVTKNAPRFLFIHGTKDTVVPISQSRILYDQLTKVGIDAEYITVQGAGHGFNGPELPNVEYKKIVDNIDAFLKETIGK